MTSGSAIVPAIVIEGTRNDWPGGPRTLTPLDPDLEPNRQTFWFGAELAPVADCHLGECNTLLLSGSLWSGVVSPGGR